jgi:hypothetical protein
VKLIARIFNRAVLVGDIDVSPIKRVPETRRPRVRKRDNALTVAQLERLAEAAASGKKARSQQARRRDRLIVLVLGFAGCAPQRRGPPGRGYPPKWQPLPAARLAGRGP